jgi:nitrile hydratase alpha subunit
MSKQENPLAKVIAQAWSDEDYKQRLVDDPAGALAEAGAGVPEGVQLRVVEDTDTLKHLVLPAAPGDGEIDEEDLERVSGGTCACFVPILP